MLSTRRVGGRTLLVYRGDVRGLRRWLAAARGLGPGVWTHLGSN